MQVSKDRESELRLGERYADIRSRIDAAAIAAQRGADDISLVAVSKTVEPAMISALIQLGHRQFGENRVQEALSKWPSLKQATSGLELHLIGPLQTNKLRDALSIFDVIETLDREKLALALMQARDAGASLPRLFVQINIGEEPQKAGVMPNDADQFLRNCREKWKLMIEGLMCIPPAAENPAPYFAKLKEIAGRNGLRQLSMGMSGDFETAIAKGATHIRVGSALFGARS